MKLKIDFSLPKLVRVRFGVQLGLDVGAKVDVRLRLRGKEPLRWKAALLRGEAKKPEAARELSSVAVPRDVPRA
jgi:hypothetical protein